MTNTLRLPWSRHKRVTPAVACRNDAALETKSEAGLRQPRLKSQFLSELLD
jgi:hypothetical protein